MAKLLQILIATALVVSTLGTQTDFDEAYENLTDEEKIIADGIREVFYRYQAGADQGIRPRGLVSEVNKFCDCGGNNCGCCNKVDAMGVSMNLCVNVSVVPEEYAFRVKAKLGFMNVYDTKINAKKLEHACSNLPLLSKMEVCLTSKMYKIEGDGFKSCMQFELQGYGTSFAYLNFQCLQYTGGQLTAVQPDGDLEKDSTVSMNSPNPIQALIDFIKKVKENEKKN